MAKPTPPAVVPVWRALNELEVAIVGLGFEGLPHRVAMGISRLQADLERLRASVFSLEAAFTEEAGID